MAPLRGASGVPTAPVGAAFRGGGRHLGLIAWCFWARWASLPKDEECPSRVRVVAGYPTPLRVSLAACRRGGPPLGSPCAGGRGVSPAWWRARGASSLGAGGGGWSGRLSMAPFLPLAGSARMAWPVGGTPLASPAPRGRACLTRLLFPGWGAGSPRPGSPKTRCCCARPVWGRRPPSPALCGFSLGCSAGFVAVPSGEQQGEAGPCRLVPARGPLLAALQDPPPSWDFTCATGKFFGLWIAAALFKSCWGRCAFYRCWELLAHRC